MRGSYMNQANTAVSQNTIQYYSTIIKHDFMIVLEIISIFFFYKRRPHFTH